MPARTLLLVALVLLPLFPVAGAQAPSLALEVVVEPFAAPIAPLSGVGMTNVTARVPCALLRGDSGTLRLWAEPAPAWLDGVVFTPQETRVDLMGCGADSVAIAATLTTRATAAAPAFEPEALVVKATFESGGQNATSSAQLMVEADYFAILEANLVETIRVGSPGERLVYPVEVVNKGNGPTRFVLEVAEISDGFSAEVPQPFTLEAGASRTVGIALTNPSGGGYRNEVGVLSVRVHAAHADGRGAETGEQMISLLATAKGVSAPTPAPGVALVLALVVLVAYSRRVFSR